MKLSNFFYRENPAQFATCMCLICLCCFGASNCLCVLSVCVISRHQAVHVIHRPFMCVSSVCVISRHQAIRLCHLLVSSVGIKLFVSPVGIKPFVCASSVCIICRHQAVRVYVICLCHL